MCQVEKMEMGELPVIQNIVKETALESDCCVIANVLSFSSTIICSGKIKILFKGLEEVHRISSNQLPSGDLLTL